MQKLTKEEVVALANGEKYPVVHTWQDAEGCIFLQPSFELLQYLSYFVILVQGKLILVLVPRFTPAYCSIALDEPLSNSAQFILPGGWLDFSVDCFYYIDEAGLTTLML